MAAPPGPVVLKATGVHKYYGSVHALAGVDVEVRKGEVVGFLGPNGAGKTTFTKCVVGFLRPSAGAISLFGVPLHDNARPALGRVGVVPDQYDFYGTLNGIQHLRFYGRLYGMPEHAIGPRIAEVLGQVGMAEHARRKVREYSHGMKQRLCIAQALINRPEFVIFDEPSNGLDPRGAFEVRQLIKGLARSGTAIFLSSHILSEVEEVCDRVAILSKGRILVQSTVADLRRKMRGDKTTVTIVLDNPSPSLETLAMDRGGAAKATLQENRLVCELSQGSEVPDLIGVLAKNGARILSVKEETLGLEQMFLELTRGEGGL